MDQPSTVGFPDPLRHEFAALLAGRLPGEVEALVVCTPVVRAAPVGFDTVGRGGRDVDLHAGKRRQKGADGVSRVDGRNAGLEERPARCEERGHGIGVHGSRDGLIALHGIGDFACRRLSVR